MVFCVVCRTTEQSSEKPQQIPYDREDYEQDKQGLLTQTTSN